MNKKIEKTIIKFIDNFLFFILGFMILLASIWKITFKYSGIADLFIGGFLMSLGVFVVFAQFKFNSGEWK